MGDSELLRRIASLGSEHRAKLATLLQPEPTPIAIVGMAGHFPEAPNLQAFWQNLRDGVESITFFTDEQLLVAGESWHRVANSSITLRPSLKVRRVYFRGRVSTIRFSDVAKD